jgi:protein-S-isoprenylcysteine O-methyltransferase Ste14
MMAGVVGRAPAPLVAWGNFLFKWRNTVFPVVMVALFAAFRPLDGGRWEAEDWVDLAGFTAVLAGSLLRVMVVGMAYIKRGGVNKKVYADDLVTGGMFAHGRNPLYVGNLLVLAGILAIHGSPWVLGLGAAFFGVSYIAIVAAEERYLAEKFGDAYQAYCRDVPRWRIRLAGLSRTLEGFRFNWRRVVIKEYTTLATTCLMVLALLGEEAVYAREELSEAVPALLAVGTGMVLTALAALAVRVLKKSGRLRENPAQA